MRRRALSTSASVGTCHSIVQSTLAERSGSIAGSRTSRVDPRPKQRQPLDGLVAEHEANVTIGNLAAPATHRGGDDLLPEQTIGHLDTVQSEGGDIEQQRPSARRPHDREAVELAERLVAPPLNFWFAAARSSSGAPRAARVPIWANPLGTSPL